MISELKNIKYLAFDIDGTIFSSEEIILDVYRESIDIFKNKTGSKIELPSKENLMAQIGKPVKTIFLNLLPDLSENDRDEISDSVLQILCGRVSRGDGHIYDEVQNTIIKLYNLGYRLLTASNGRLPYINSILTVSKIDKYFFDKVILNYSNIKVKGDILKFYISKYSINNDEILMIGDRYSDYEAAKDSDVPFLFCEYGHAVEGEIPNYTAKISSFKELLSILQIN